MMAVLSKEELGVVRIRPMRQEDVAQVNEIDREALSAQEPAPDYQRELNNQLAHYLVASVDTSSDTKPEIKPAEKKGFSGLALRLERFYSRCFRRERLSSPPPMEYILGFAGLWMLADEAHIISIAVRKRHHHYGVGELMLLNLIDMATGLNASTVNLEVRATNIAAQGLYSKCGFAGVGIRRGYYSDNKEDAILMTLHDITSSHVRTMLQRLEEVHSQRWGMNDNQIAR